MVHAEFSQVNCPLSPQPVMQWGENALVLMSTHSPTKVIIKTGILLSQIEIIFDVSLHLDINTD